MGKDYKKICRSCLTFECCKKSGFSAFLTKSDIQKIKEKTRLSEIKFAQKKKFKNKYLWFLKRKNGHCIFFDESQSSYKRCKIYSFRPFDCKLFPLDIVLENKKFLLIKYTICNGNGNSLKDQIKIAKQKILPGLKQCLFEYANFPTEFHKKGYWEKLDVLE